MATYNKFNQFVEDIAEKEHNLGSDQLKVALTNTAPTASDSILSDITEISYTNCSSRDITTDSSAQAGGVYSLKLTDLVLTALGGSVGAFRYVVIYNDTSTNDKLIAWFDYGSPITLNDGEDITIDFDANGLLTLQ